ncbi:hypothetical protein Tco_0159835, partial [Tanacetum coccineum]
MAAHTERMEIFENTIFKQQAKFPVTKNVNSNSPARNEEEENNKTDETPDNTKMPIEMEMPLRKAEAVNGAENGAENENPSKKKKGKAYKVLPGGPVYDAILKKTITKKEDIGGNFKIPCSIGDLKHVNALVDQGSD